MIISVTRLRLRSWRYLLPFFLQTIRILLQTMRTEGFRNGRLLADQKLVFWTVTRWESEDALLTWRNRGAHGSSMAYLAKWCSEAAVVRWQIDGKADFPDWGDCSHKIAASGNMVVAKRTSNSGENQTIRGTHKQPRGLVLPFRKL
jgi:hypothetical protein